MKKTILFILMAFLCLNSFAQISFEKGSFTTNTGTKTNCYIKNIDWKNNPVEFKYRLTQNSKIQTGTIETVSNFEIGTNIHYKRFTLSIDRSSNRTGKLTNNRNPIYKEETLFLKLLVSGKASLWQYQSNQLFRFFYQINNSNPIQLEHKKYLTSSGLIAENNAFKLQLKKDLPCKKIKTEKTVYRKKHLISYFHNYNTTCTKSSSVAYEEYSSIKKPVNIYLKVGAQFSSLELRSNDLGSQIRPQFGVEFEYTLPNNKGKWAMFIEPTFHSYSVKDFDVVVNSFTNNNPTLPITHPLNFKYSAIKTPMGIKHNMFLNKKSKITLTAGYVINLSLTSKIEFLSSTRSDLDIISSAGFVVGAGYNWDSKYSLNIQMFKSGRFNTVGGYNDPWDTNEYKSFSINFGYKIF